MEPRTEVLREMEALGFDGRLFCDDLEATCESRRRRGKTNRRNRYDSYMKWAVFLYKANVGQGRIESPKYAFPPSVLTYIRRIVPGDVKGEILDDGFAVSMEQFCQALQMPRL